MIRRLAFASVSVVALGLAAPAAAQSPAPGARPKPATVAAILAQPVDDQKVTLTGVIVRKLSDETYIFSDGSGEIQVEIDDDELPAGPLAANARVEIRGEVEIEDQRKVEIDVDSVRLL